MDVHELPDLTITKLSVGPMDNNAYLLRCRATGEQVLIDAANEPQRLLRLAGDGGLARVVTTHRHFDHWQGLAAVLAATGARAVAHPDDAAELPAKVTEPVVDGDTVPVGTCVLEVIHLVGHTPGSIALLYRDPAGGPHLFTGDSLFPGGPGRTTNPQDFTSLMDDLETKVFGRLPDDTVVYPGHGADTTLGKERPAIPEWRARGW
ncbi:MAG: MBL fold metallo-hydrolase [Actinobacteria bacterium]|nr:MAG: MBL fold metallo-hydrolase [Actinomycetota bacterium]